MYQACEGRSWSKGPRLQSNDPENGIKHGGQPSAEIILVLTSRDPCAEGTHTFYETV